ncbi:hypothetical protein, partial [Bartonella sp. F02]|uniref:hypothetical protein n=1 Tax=Bartonella sp. F02 TaxID=2967262 RepID=UPI0022A95B2E
MKEYNLKLFSFFCIFFFHITTLVSNPISQNESTYEIILLDDGIFQENADVSEIRETSSTRENISPIHYDVSLKKEVSHKSERPDVPQK